MPLTSPRPARSFNGTRGPFGSNFSNDDFEGSFGNSNYNSLQASLRHSGKRLDVMLAYTYSKSIDQASSISDVVDPFNLQPNARAFGLGSDAQLRCDIPVSAPVRSLSSHAKILTTGWAISGITRAQHRLPGDHASDGDNSLQGSLPNGVNNHSPGFAGLLRRGSLNSTAIRATGCRISTRRSSPRTHWELPAPRRGGRSTGRDAELRSRSC